MGYRINKFINIIKNLIFVPACAACKERLSPLPEKGNLTYNRACLCRSCSEKWERAKAQMCHNCGYVSAECTCAPKYFFDRQTNIPSLCFYHPDSGDTQSNVIITLKRNRDVEIFDFLAAELYPKLRKTIDSMGLKGNDCIFTWIPRSRRAEAKSGFDQGKIIAARTAKLFGAKTRPIFLRIGGSEQKKLDKNQRLKNARLSIKLNYSLHGFPHSTKETDVKEFIKGKNVIIIDDVLTSGATLRQGVELLESIGVENTVVACIAKTEGKSK